ncbi:ATP-binding cassette domain-containing protein [Geobacter sp. SVR]|uniref:ATP-binding cassette domain-containing protein n=1 Tax=Geobacter sp. SVR TaxID=2495594 RepID=UPI00143EFC74|nr:ATP-binding cassette domain-containing protein [Geobacter sp. SVR]BCS54164.1 ABC transporter ATP-binding protein [Geobacter sp. SVR]GCF85978.1 ABC transporter [Geobacter sp. SVR]
MTEPYSEIAVPELVRMHPDALDYFRVMGVRELPPAPTVAASIAALQDEVLEDIGLTRQELLDRFEAHLTEKSRGHIDQSETLHSITVIGGKTKSGNAESFAIDLRPGEVTCIVGPTGSGKSRFLADIEWLAQGDSPTGRRILINGTAPEPHMRYAVDKKLVAQLSQNMNFVMDLTVEEFIVMHAESRMIGNVADVAATVIDLANTLAGECLAADTPVTALSGGQSRALMIADVACLSSSPIVLIDEIENAGIDRKRALALLTGKNKIVLMATHDPILALMGQRRLVFGNGGIVKIIETSEAERLSLRRFEQMDAELGSVRSALRKGELVG